MTILKHSKFCRRSGLLLIALICVCVLSPNLRAQLNPQQNDTVALIQGSSIPSLVAKAKELLLENDFNTALDIYNDVLGRYKEGEKENLEEFESAYNNAGYIYFYHLADYEKAYQYWIKALELGQKYNLQKTEAVLLNLANMYVTMRDDAKAKKFYRETIKNAQQQKNYDIMLTAFSNMAILMMTNGEPQEDMSEALGYDLSSVPDTVPMKRYCNLLQDGLELFSQGRTLDAIPVFQEAIKNIDTQLTPERYQIGLTTVCASIYSKNDNIEDALNMLLAADSIARLYPMLDYRLDINHELGSLYQRAKIENRRRTQSLVLLAVGIGMVVVAALLVWVFRLYRREHAKNHVLYQKNMELINLSKPIAVTAGDKSRYKSGDISKIPGHGGTLDKSDGGLQNQTVNTDNEIMGRSDGEAQDKSDDKPKGTAISDQKKAELQIKIEQILESPEIFNPDFSIDDIVKSTSSNQRYVSQIINEVYGKSLAALLTQLRITEACRLISENNDRFTIEAIASNVGYRSRSSFSKAFRRLTGLSPTEFLLSSKQ